MPLLKIQTNAKVPDDKRDALLKKASRAVAQQLSKPEQYMMATLETERLTAFAGTTDDTVMLAYKTQAQKVKELVKKLAEIKEFKHLV